jgi:8-oxo-dGTP pyrophosphatase MutT (NUDIX family)
MTPRDAAGLVLLRHEGLRAPEVLLGRRSQAMVFMPGYYVFPGGRVDSGEQPSEAAPGRPLPPGIDEATLALLPRLRAAALRELEEETGFRVPSAQQGHLHPLARAITPPGNPRRFDTRFFLLLEPRLEGSPSGDGELEDVGWLAVDRLSDLPVANITARVLREALAFLENPEHTFQLVTDARSLG